MLGGHLTASSRAPARIDGSHSATGAATVALTLQVCYIYWFTAALKWHPDWIQGHALHYALQIDYLVRPLGRWLGDHLVVARILSYATLVVEAFVPFLLLLNRGRAYVRCAAILSMVAFHAGIAFTMDIGIFPYVSMLCWVPFLPPEFLNAIELKVTNLWGGRTKFVAPSLPEPRLAVTARTTAAAAAARAVVVGLLVFITVYNVLGLDQLQARGVRMPAAMRVIARALRVEQKWGMFAPSPRVLDGWYIMPAVLANGTTVDVWADHAPAFEKPPSVLDRYPGFRVKNFLHHFRGQRDSPIWPYVARLCGATLESFASRF